MLQKAKRGQLSELCELAQENILLGVFYLMKSDYGKWIRWQSQLQWH